jgi:rhodanese-related sulfurtransferase
LAILAELSTATPSRVIGTIVRLAAAVVLAGGPATLAGCRRSSPPPPAPPSPAAAPDSTAPPSNRDAESLVRAAIEQAAASAPEAERDGECRFDTDCSGDRVCDHYECIRWWQLHGETPELDANTVHELATSGQVQILDVRTRAEYRQGHIEGAHSVPLGKLEESRFDLPVDRDTPVVAVCLTAHRSIAAVRLLQRLGYDVVQLAGGMISWRKAKLPETREPPADPQTKADTAPDSP